MQNHFKFWIIISKICIELALFFYFFLILMHWISIGNANANALENLNYFF